MNKGIPNSASNLGAHLQKLFSEMPLFKSQKDLIDGSLNKVEETMKTKIHHVMTVSDYYNDLWIHKNLTEEERNHAIEISEALQMHTCDQIIKGIIKFPQNTNTTDDLMTEYDDLNEYEEKTLQEKTKEWQKKTFISQNRVNFSMADPEIMQSLNLTSGLSKSLHEKTLHYNSGIIDLVGESEKEKKKNVRVFLNGIKKKMTTFHKKAQEIQEKHDSIEKERLELILESQRQEKELKNKKRRQEMEDHIKRLNEKRKLRLENLHDRTGSQDMRRKKELPLYEIMTQRYREKVELPMLNEMERKLQLMKNLKAPLPRGIFAKWKLEHDEKMEEYAKAHPKKQLVEESVDFDKSQSSRYYKSAELEVTDFKRSYMRELKKKKERREKLFEYDKVIKEEIHIPIKRQPTPEPVIEIPVSPNRGLRNAEEAKDPNYKKMLGLQYLRQSKSNARAKTQEQYAEAKSSPMTSRKEYGLDTKKMQGDKTLTQSTMATTRKDYLVTLRQNGVMKTRLDMLEDVISSRKLDPSKRKQILWDQKNKLDSMLDRHFELRKLQGKKDLHKNIDQDGEIDGFLVGAIKTKLAILDNIF